MQRVSTHDRDRAFRRLSALTGAITAGSLALTGAFMALAKHETEEKNARKAALKAAQHTLPGALSLAAEVNATTSSPAPTSTPPSTTRASRTSASAKVKSSPTTSSPTTSSPSTSVRRIAAPTSASQADPVARSAPQAQPQPPAVTSAGS